jgi:hypothetical protein
LASKPCFSSSQLCAFPSTRAKNNATAVNLGTNIGTSFESLGHLVAEAVGYSTHVAIQKDMPKGVANRVGDDQFLRSLGCEPRTTVRDVVRLTVDFLNGERLPDPSVGRVLEIKGLSDAPQGAHGLAASSQSTTRQEAVAPSAKYSSYQCAGAGGTQRFPENWKLQRTNSAFPSGLDRTFTVCKFENICYVDGKLTFFGDPELFPHIPSSIKPWTGMVATSYLKPRSLEITTQLGPMPDSLPLGEHDVYLLQSSSFSDNFGHMMIDDMMPGFIALDMFDLHTDAVRIIMNPGCFFEQHWYMNPTYKIPRKEICEKNYRLWSKYLWDAPIWMEKDTPKNVCFRTAIAGHSSAFSLSSLELARGGFLRRFRDRVYSRLPSGGKMLPPQPTHKHHILVCSKNVGFTPNDWKSICSDVQKSVSSFTPIPEIVCEDLSTMPLENQIALIAKATIIVAVHGTVSYAALFARDRTVLIAVGTQELKEPQILLPATHFHTLYLWREDADFADQLDQNLLFALNSDPSRGKTSLTPK